MCSVSVLRLGLQRLWRFLFFASLYMRSGWKSVLAMHLVEIPAGAGGAPSGAVAGLHTMARLVREQGSEQVEGRQSLRKQVRCGYRYPHPGRAGNHQRFVAA